MKTNLLLTLLPYLILSSACGGLADGFEEITNPEEQDFSTGERDENGELTRAEDETFDAAFLGDWVLDLSSSSISIPERGDAALLESSHLVIDETPDGVFVILGLQSKLLDEGFPFFDERTFNTDFSLVMSVLEEEQQISRIESTESLTRIESDSSAEVETISSTFAYGSLEDAVTLNEAERYRVSISGGEGAQLEVVLSFNDGVQESTQGSARLLFVRAP